MRFPSFAVSEAVDPKDARFDSPDSTFALENLEGLLTAAERHEVVEGPPADLESARRRAGKHSRWPAIVEDLRLLGYLPSEETLPEVSIPLVESAVWRLQEDASCLTVDGWVGDETWQALRRLVTFEEATGIEDFLRPDGRPGQALIRALQLRLYALGVLEKPPGATVSRLPWQAMARYWEIATYLGFESGDQPDNQELIRRIFDHDQIVIGISNSSRVKRDSNDGLEGFDLSVTGGDGLSENRLMNVQRFLVSVAKVELWLLGFEVDINRLLDYPVLGVRKKTPARGPLKKALRKFWRELVGCREDWSKKMVKYITPALFHAVARIESKADSTADESVDRSDAVLEEVGHTRSKIRKAWFTGKRIGMKLWDGLKRIWRWIVRGVRRILRVGQNHFRAFFSYANRAFRIARTAVKTIVRALEQYLGASIDTGSGNPFQVALAGDGDIAVVIPEEASTADLARAVDNIDYFGVAFEFSTQVLGSLVKAVRAAFGAVAANVAGWARFVWILVRSYRDLQPAWTEFRAAAVPEDWS